MATEKSPQQLSNSLAKVESAENPADTELLSVTILQHDHAVAVAYVAGEIDMLTGPSLRRHLDDALATQPERLIVDLSHVSFLGATGLAVLINAQRAATQQGANLQLCGVSSAAALPLQATELAYLFEVLPPVEDLRFGTQRSTSRLSSSTLGSHRQRSRHFCVLIPEFAGRWRAHRGSITREASGGHDDEANGRRCVAPDELMMMWA